MHNTFRYSALETAGATTLKSSSGVLHSIVVGETTAFPITIWDSAGSGGTKIGTLKASIAENTFCYNTRFAKGLHIENPGGSKITVSYA